MAILAAEGLYSRFSSLVKMHDTPQRLEFHTQLYVANEVGTPTYSLGTVLGVVTATGKVIACVRTAVDGSQTPAAIYIGNSFGAIVDTTLVAATDTKVLTLARGKVIVSAQALKLDASFAAGAQTVAAYASLLALGIMVEQSN